MPAPAPLRSWSRCLIALAATALSVATVGCQEEAEPQAAPVVQRTPEEKFNSIVELLDNRLSDNLNDVTAVTDYDSPAGTPVTDAQIEVSGEMTPPASEGEPYRASVCLTTKSKVTVVLPPPDEGDKERADEESDTKRAKMAEGLDGVADLDSLVVPSNQGIAARLGKSPIHEIDPGESQSCYELEYRDDAWVLVSELDRENKPFNAIAIEWALNMQ